MSHFERPQELQESRYQFPYHHLPRYGPDGFQQGLSYRGGYLYISYLGFVMQLLERRPFHSLLDVGCGDGRLVAEIMSRFAPERVVGIDTSQRAILLARAMCSQGEFRAGDVTDSRLEPGPFDVVTLIEVLEHVRPDQAPTLMAAVAERLRPAGRLIVTVPTTRADLNPKHYRHFDLESLIEAVGDGFSLVENYYLNRDSSWVRTIDRLLTNRFFAVREPRLLAWWQRHYERRWLEARPESGLRLCAVFERTP